MIKESTSVDFRVSSKIKIEQRKKGSIGDVFLTVTDELEYLYEVPAIKVADVLRIILCQCKFGNFELEHA